MRAPITSVKHYVQQGIDTQLAGGRSTDNIIRARAVQDIADAEDVVEGSVIKAVFCELWLLAGGQQPGSFTLTIEKLPAGATSSTFAEMAQLHTYANKKNILYTTQGLIGDANANPTPVIRSWIKIPRGKQRFGLDDKLLISVSANIEDMDRCGFYTYKAYT